MPRSPRVRRLVLLVVLAVLFPFSVGLAQEEPPRLQADAILPKGMLSGPDYRVDPLVKNDGAMNTYLLHSRYGQFTVVSTALLWTRITEIKAMKAIEAVGSGERFGNSVLESGKNTVAGAADLVIHPLDSLRGAVSGVGKMFSRAEESMTSTQSKYEDSKTKAVIGYAGVKREYALAFGVDPYSTNPELQERLGRLASAGYAGGVSVTALKLLIPGGVGLAVSSVSGTTWLKDVDLSQPPTDLRRQNREKLLGMSLKNDLVTTFINNAEFTPTQQTLLTAALAAMPGVTGKDRMLRLAVSTASQEEALFRQRLALLLAGHHLIVEHFDRLETVGTFVAGRTVSGKLVLLLPVDYLAWTAANAKLLGQLPAEARKLGAWGVELWVSGQASPLTRDKLAELRIELREDADNALRR